jgi:hypothetical protein
MRRRWIWVGQAVLALLVAGFVGRALVRHWDEFSALELSLDFHAGSIALAALTVWLTYALLIEAWRRVVLGWGEVLPYRPAVRIWCLSNLGRYLPGKVWGVAGLAVLAQRAGVSGWAAAGSALAMQALAVGTGASVVAVFAPGAVSPLQLVIAGVLALGAVGALTSRSLGERVTRLVRPDAEFRELSPGTALAAAVITLAGWVAYGVAFWLLARGLLGAGALSLWAAIGVFTAGYIVGFLALFAPGGVGVRELMFVAMLTPLMGSGDAVALSVASRLLLSVTESGAALAALALGGRPKEEGVDGQAV